MRKALIPMLASLALCGAATTAMVMSSARAQPAPHKPMMVADAATPELQLAANDAPPPRGLRPPSPEDIAARVKQFCNDGYARQTAQLAYLEVSLQLTASEQPLFQHWKDAKLDIARHHADACAQRPMAQRGARAAAQDGQRFAARFSPADRMTREEDHLKQRLADLESERPALEAFYNALSPQQKMELMRQAMEEQGGGRGMEGGMMHHHMFADAMGPRGPMGGRPMEGGPMGAMDRPPGPPDAPPPER